MRYEKLQHLSIYLRRLTIMVATAAFGLWAMPSEPAVAGVGYDAYARGKRNTYYETENLNTGERIGVFRPNVQLLATGTRDQMRAAWEGRYGIGSSPYGALDANGQPTGNMKRWTRAPNNELRFVVENALAWWYAEGRPLGGSCSLPCSGVPTEQEIIDAQATGDAAIWDAWLALQPGFIESNPLHVTRTDKPHGPFTEYVAFWSRDLFMFNDGELVTPPPPPPPPPVDPPVDPPPTPAICATCCPACPAPPAISPACAPMPEFVRRTIVKGARFTSQRAWSAVRSWASTCPGWVAP